MSVRAAPARSARSITSRCCCAIERTAAMMIADISDTTPIQNITVPSMVWKIAQSAGLPAFTCPRNPPKSRRNGDTKKRTIAMAGMRMRGVGEVVGTVGFVIPES